MNNKKIDRKKVIIVTLVIALLGSISLLIFSKENSILKLLGIVGNIYSSENTDTYGEFRNLRAYSNFRIFPDELDTDMDINAYFWKYQDIIFDPAAQVYLECTYDEDRYEEEIGRLQAIQEEYNGEVKKILYDTENFSYPAHVTIYANNHCYEYALILGDRKIAYVFLQFANQDDIKIPADYLPKEYDYRRKPDNAYSIYVFYQEDGLGVCIY